MKWFSVNCCARYPSKNSVSHIDESVRFDSDGEGSNVCESSFKLYTVRHSREVEDASAGR